MELRAGLGSNFFPHLKVQYVGIVQLLNLDSRHIGGSIAQ